MPDFTLICLFFSIGSDIFAILRLALSKCNFKQ